MTPSSPYCIQAYAADPQRPVETARCRYARDVQRLVDAILGRHPECSSVQVMADDHLLYVINGLVRGSRGLN